MYKLQVGNGFLGYKFDDGVMCESLKKVTIADKESVGLGGGVEIVGVSAKTLNSNDD